MVSKRETSKRGRLQYGGGCKGFRAHVGYATEKDFIMPTAARPILSLTFTPRAGDKGSSKNYDILTTTTDPDNKFPLLLSNQGALYIKKGLVDPAKVKTVRIEVFSE